VVYDLLKIVLYQSPESFLETVKAGNWPLKRLCEYCVSLRKKFDIVSIIHKQGSYFSSDSR